MRLTPFFFLVVEAAGKGTLIAGLRGSRTTSLDKAMEMVWPAAQAGQISDNPIFEESHQPVAASDGP